MHNYTSGQQKIVKVMSLFIHSKRQISVNFVLLCFCLNIKLLHCLIQDFLER